MKMAGLRSNEDIPLWDDCKRMAEWALRDITAARDANSVPRVGMMLAAAQKSLESLLDDLDGMKRCVATGWPARGDNFETVALRHLEGHVIQVLPEDDKDGD